MASAIDKFVDKCPNLWVITLRVKTFKTVASILALYEEAKKDFPDLDPAKVHVFNKTFGTEITFDIQSEPPKEYRKRTIYDQ